MCTAAKTQHKYKHVEFSLKMQHIHIKKQDFTPRVKLKRAINPCRTFTL